MNEIGRPNHPNSLRSIATGLAALLFAKVFLSILYQYRFYFPADFESDFLSLRRDSFHGLYRVAFYVHILSAPTALLAGLFLVVSGPEKRFRKMHRWAGRMLAMLVLCFVSPSGLVMASHAPAGAFAGAGLGALAIGTATCVVMAVRHARRHQIRNHQRWATRCFILLCSPLLLRLITGFVIVTRLDPDWNDRINPWISWLVPFVGYEIWWRWAENPVSPSIPASKREAMS